MYRPLAHYHCLNRSHMTLRTRVEVHRQHMKLFSNCFSDDSLVILKLDFALTCCHSIAASLLPKNYPEISK